nr:PREDICTED: uncharacterized protein LOC109034463 [Bemisia tabaci]
MDAVISGFKKRFQNLPFAKAIDKFWELDLQGAKEFVDHYKDAMKVDIDMLQAEVNVMKNVLQNRGKELNFKNLKTEINEDFMPNLYKLLQVSIGLSISSANCERSFSAMRRIKTWLRTTMMQTRFSNLSLLHIESTMVKVKNFSGRVIDMFSKQIRKLRFC